MTKFIKVVKVVVLVLIFLIISLIVITINYLKSKEFSDSITEAYQKREKEEEQRRHPS